MKSGNQNISEARSDEGIKYGKKDRIAIFITNTFGSLKFLTACVLFFTLWIISNTNLIPRIKPFDPYPFPALEMVVSIFAIILSVSVLISQNRQGKMEELRQKVEFEVNICAETEITKVLEMLHSLQKKMGIDTPDSELEQMKENLDIDELHEKLKKDKT